MCTVTVVVWVVVVTMALRTDVMIDLGDCGQAQTASSRASVVPSAHVKRLGSGRKGRAAGHLVGKTMIVVLTDYLEGCVNDTLLINVVWKS